MNRTALSLYAEELVKMLNEVINHRPEKLPDYVVAASDLHLLPVESLTKAEVSLAVRMDRLEKSVQELVKKPMVAVREVAREPQEVARTVPQPAPAAALPGGGAGTSVAVPDARTAVITVPGAAAAAVSAGEVIMQEASEEVLCEEQGNFLQT